jgi:prolyl-tRNA synthetase
MFNSWIHSHRDLPLKINQWANIVRWEMRTRPFLRTSEFLWQEGHTAHASSQEAFAFSQRILDMYAEFCQDVLAIPVVKGEKSPSERFAGAEATLTIEALMQNGWALQSGTSHFLGQNFARAFEVHFQNENNERELVWATSWGVSTRLIGALLMTHSDDKGIVLPPRVSPHQVVLVPILTGKEEKDQKVLGKCHEILRALEEASVRAHLDDRRNLRHGAKYFEWERKGIPLRIDVGLRDLEKNASPMTERVGGEKVSVSLDPAQLVPAVLSSLSSLQTRLLSRAQERLQQRTYRLSDYSEMKRLMADPAHAPGFYLVPWRDNAEAEEFIKTDSKATIRCFPFEHNSSPPDASVRCFYSKEPATHFAIFARAF